MLLISGSNVSVFSLHPGGVSTDLGRNIAGLINQSWKVKPKSQSEPRSQ